MRSTAPSLQASNQSQIDDLVQRNRTLEYTNKKQAEEYAADIQKTKDSIIVLQQQWQGEQAEWRQGCDILQSCHRVVQLQNLIEAEKERRNVLKEMDVTRIEKLKRLQRDFRITMFQARETELEERISELEEEREALVIEYEENIRRLKGRHAQYVAQIRAKEDEHAVVDQERDELQDKLAKSNDDNARLQNSVDSLNSKLERTALKLEGAQTKCVELERNNAELIRTNADVHRQVEKWQELDTKGGSETDAQRKKCMELELQIKDFEERLEGMKEEKDHAIAKERRKVDKLIEKVTEWQNEASKHEQQSSSATKELARAQKELLKVKNELEIERAHVRPKADVERLEQEIEDLNKRLAKAQKQNVKLKDELEVERARVHAPSPESKQKAPPPNADGFEVISYHDSRPSTPPAEMPKPKGKGKGKQGQHPSKSRKATTEPEEAGLSHSNHREKPDSLTSDAEKTIREKRKGRVKPGGDAQGDPEVQPRKRKASSQESDIEVVESLESLPAAVRRKGSGETKHEGNEVKNPNSKARSGKGAARAPSINIQEVPNQYAEEAAPKKKKRKINVFPPLNDSSAFSFMQPLDTGLGIPTILSPVKEMEGVPTRSTSGSVMGSIGSVLKKSFAVRRR